MEGITVMVFQNIKQTVPKKDDYLHGSSILQLSCSSHIKGTIVLSMQVLISLNHCDIYTLHNCYQVFVAAQSWVVTYQWGLNAKAN